jgi:hypothetical protein
VSELSASNLIDRVWEMSKRLKTARISHEIKVFRYDGVSILAHVPGQYWEIDMLADGSIDFEVFRSTSFNETDLDSAIAEYSEP